MAEEYTDFESLDDLFREIGIAKPAETRRKPFKFLDPYGIEDRDIFFGRDLEISEIYSRFYRSRILLVYGESGSGKTSLVQCGLGSEIPAEDVQFITVRSAVSPLESLKKEILKIATFPDGESLSCADMLQEAVFIKSKTIGLIFDQFEEFFIFQPSSVRDQFILEMNDWLARDLNIRIVICIREEYLARMTEMEAFIPQLYQNRLWVRRMSREQAQEREKATNIVLNNPDYPIIFSSPDGAHHNNDVTSVCFSHDGKILASGSEYEGTFIRLWDVETGEV